MNKDFLRETEIMNDALFNFKRITGIQKIDEKPSSNILYDYDIRINGHNFATVIKGNITKANLNIILKKIYDIKREVNCSILLISSSITQEAIEILKMEGINVLESSGNCTINEQGLFIHIKGEKKGKVKDIRKNPFSESGIKLVFYFLAEPNGINKTYREISEETGLSLGTITNVVEELKKSGLIVVMNNKRVIKNRKELLDIWQTHYNQILKPKLLIREMDFINPDTYSQLADIKLPDGMVWGGEAGAYLKNQFMTPAQYEIYTDVSTLKLLSTKKFKYTQAGPVKLYQKFWKTKDNEDIANKVILYADLMGSGKGRSIEAAEKLIENGI